MVYKVIREIKGRLYAYEQESVRQGNKVITKSRYLGTVDGVTREVKTPREPSPIENHLDSKIDLSAFKISQRSLEESFLHLGSAQK